MQEFLSTPWVLTVGWILGAIGWIVGIISGILQIRNTRYEHGRNDCAIFFL
jgi:hypothetical protein